MRQLFIRFGVRLNDYSLEEIEQRQGPLFHRWLPDGEKDAITLDTEDENLLIRVWFERRGFSDGTFIRYDQERREVDPEVMAEQALLDAGPLMGEVTVYGLSEEELTPIIQNKIGDTTYVALGTRVAKTLYASVSKLLDLLRINYGQYWIRELETWDSRQRSLGSYCGGVFRMVWSIDGENWSKFVPNEQTQSGYLEVGPRPSYSEYLSEENWRQLEEVIRASDSPSPAAVFLARSHRLMDREDVRYAFIEGVTALEMALGEFMRRNLSSSESLLKSIEPFYNIPLPARLATVSAVLREGSSQDLELGLKAIKTRNEVIHDGKDSFDRDDRAHLAGLLRATAALLSPPSFKFPSNIPGNERRPLEQWHEEG